VVLYKSPKRGMTSQKRGKNGVRSVKNEAMLRKGRGGQKRGKPLKRGKRNPLAYTLK